MFTFADGWTTPMNAPPPPTADAVVWPVPVGGEETRREVPSVARSSWFDPGSEPVSCTYSCCCLPEPSARVDPAANRDWFPCWSPAIEPPDPSTVASVMSELEPRLRSVMLLPSTLCTWYVKPSVRPTMGDG